jgi:hypothetical protein
MTNNEELIVYSNSRNGLGIRVIGAKRPTHRSGIYIKQLLDDGLAKREGRLKVKIFKKKIFFSLNFFL